MAVPAKGPAGHNGGQAPSACMWCQQEDLPGAAVVRPPVHACGASQRTCQAQRWSGPQCMHVVPARGPAGHSGGQAPSACMWWRPPSSRGCAVRVAELGWLDALLTAAVLAVTRHPKQHHHFYQVATSSPWGRISRQ
jgi:hypothetical protein